MAYTMYLDGVALPVTPSKLNIKIKNQNKTINLINDGEVNILKKAGLTEINFQALLPHIQYPFAKPFKPTETFLNKFEKLKTSRKPFQFICSRISPAGKLLFDTNMKVSMEKYEISEDAKNGLDIIVKITLKQYRPYGTKKLNISIAQNKALATVQKTRSAESAPNLKTYTVVRGDCLWSIAKKYLGKGSRYREIYDMNKAKIDKRNKGTGNPRYTIYSGQVFSLPSV